MDISYDSFTMFFLIKKVQFNFISYVSITLFYAHFEISHQKQVMETAIFEKKNESLNSQKKCLRSLEA